jgi:cell division protein FtsN
MAQDFAKQRSNPDGNKRKRAVSKGPQPANTNWSWFFSGLMTGVIVSIAAYLGVLKLEEDVAEGAATTVAGANPEDPPIYNFGFYETLSTAEVAVEGPPGAAPADTAAAGGNPPDTAAPSASIQSAATEEKRPDLYLLQAGSFQNQEDAESRRGQIILLNMNASVVEGVVQGRTRYRVQVGPFAGRQSAEDARNLLSANDLESIAMLVPR